MTIGSLLRLLAFTVAWSMAGGAWAQTGALPPEIAQALTRARVPADALSLVVADLDARQPPRLAHRAGVPVNPASLMKLVTTAVALDQLGVAWVWRTPVYLDGRIEGDQLQGNLVIRGSGDPKLVAERLWLLLRRVQGLGIRRISGDIVLDRSAFEPVVADISAFDGEPLRPYNAAPDALLINYKALSLAFVPDAKAGVARVHMEPPLAGVQLPRSVPLAAGDCGDWRTALKADFSQPGAVRLAGTYPASCGERHWPVAHADPGGFAARAIEGLWRELGGQLGGRAREGTAPPGLAPAFEFNSPALPDVVRDINKFSNNVMAQQVFLTLGLQLRGRGTMTAAREVVQGWWRERLPDAEPPSVENGSGLSRTDRLSAQSLARLLQWGWGAPWMPEWVSSLPMVGVDGTLRGSRARSGAAHLKTGSLRDVAAVAGIVHGASGRRWVLVAVVNMPGAASARPVLDAAIEWAQKD